MSVPHTGKLEALVNGHHCHFNGNVWTTPDSELTALLNEARESSRVTHFSIDELAQHILRKAGLESSSQILNWQGDAWQDELPPGAID